MTETSHDALITEHLWVADWQAKVHRKWETNDRADSDDLEGAARLALVEAARTWDAARGDFVPHAIATIRRALAVEDAKHTTVSASREDRQRAGKVRRAIATFDGGDYTLAELSARSGFTETYLTRLMPLVKTQRLELDRDTYALPATAASTEDTVEGDMMREAVRKAVAGLTPEQQQVADLRFGLTSGSPMTTAEIAATLDISEKRVREMEAPAVDALRISLAAWR